MVSLIRDNFWKNKKILITGHTGFKGSWLCFILNNLGSKIVGYSLKNEAYHKLYLILKIKQKLTDSIFADISNVTKLRKTIQKHKPEIIFHLAAQPYVIDSYLKPYETIISNTIGSVNILEAIKNFSFIKSVIFVTSDKCYKPKINKKSHNENDQLGGDDVYSASKASAEILINSYIKSFGENKINSSISTVRSGNILGGGDWGKNRLIKDILFSFQSKKILKVRNINAVRPWIHVFDTLSGYINLAKKNYFSKKYMGSWNFSRADNKVYSVRSILNFCIKKKYLCRSNIKITNNKYKENLILRLNSLKAKQRIRWKPKLNFEEMLEFTFNWYIANNNKENMEKFSLNQLKQYSEKK